MVEMLVSHQYQAYFCEENIWHLTKEMSGTVLLISNRRKSVAIWQQKLAEETIQVPNYNEENPYLLSNAVLWDYHVIFVGPQAKDAKAVADSNHLDSNAWVFDFDSVLPFPSPIQAYFEKSFAPRDERLPDHLRPRFRIINSEHYREHFSSDRSHMKNEHGEWTALPPEWPPIQADSKHALKLSQLLNFDSPQGGEVKTLDEIMQAISS